MSILLSLCIGLGLSACCGFRVFVPLLVANIAALTGHYHVGQSFEWLGTWTAFGVLATATGLEIGAYYIPWVDNLLDTIATPAAMIAGTILTTAFLSDDIDPMLKWVAGLIVGGGTAGLVQAGTSALRFTSSTTTGGLGNPVVATAENGLSITFSILTLLIPIIIAIFVFFFLIWVIKRLFKKR